MSISTNSQPSYLLSAKKMALSIFYDCLVAAVGGNSSLVAFPSQANYSSIVEPFNLNFPVTPAAVAFPCTAIQVAALVDCAVASNYKVQAKSGGHNAGNYGMFIFELAAFLNQEAPFQYLIGLI